MLTTDSSSSPTKDLQSGVEIPRGDLVALREWAHRQLAGLGCLSPEAPGPPGAVHLENKTITFDTENNESLEVVTVRMPKSMHDQLKHEARLNKTSLNRWCLFKLLADAAVTGNNGRLLMFTRREGLRPHVVPRAPELPVG